MLVSLVCRFKTLSSDLLRLPLTVATLVVQLTDPAKPVAYFNRQVIDSAENMKKRQPSYCPVAALFAVFDIFKYRLLSLEDFV